jgi:3-oxoacyl-(acyl-carrier-protein) synthase
LRRVAVSGIGVVSTLGNGTAELLANARACRSGVRADGRDSKS